MDLAAPAGAPKLNADAPWDAFDPHAYIDRNYRELLDVDAEIIAYVRDHFSDHFRGHFERPVLGIDVGAGANLYPALSMLPWCKEITQLELSRANVEYLREQRVNFDPGWDSFWRVLREGPAYRDIDENRRARFTDAVRVERGNLFDLVRRPAHWAIGTMFFVAESMSDSHAEFRRGVACFMRALAPGAPFAAAFMARSTGYDVGDEHFPACDVDELQVHESLRPYAGKVAVLGLKKPTDMVRPGHEGMILALGHRNSVVHF
ncbi:SCO2525 family SAM-dependent methyltransferase [Streptomyces sp. NPDC003710]